MFVRNAIISMLACSVLTNGCAVTTSVSRLSPPHTAVSPQHTHLRILARLNAWEGIPSRLDRHVTPLLITILNDSDVPVGIALEEFVLLSGDFERYSAQPPSQIHGRLDNTVEGAPFPIRGFEYADVGAYSRRPRPDEGYWSRYGTRIRTITLPTYHMMRKALPEGVLQPGGRVQGFVYFEPLRPDARDLRLRARLAGPGQSPREGWLEIPVRQ